MAIPIFLTCSITAQISGFGTKHIVRYAFRKGSQRAYFDRASLTWASAFSRRAMSALGRIWVTVPPLAEEMTKRRPGPLLTVSVATSLDTSFIDPASVQAAGAVAAAALCTRSIRDFQSATPSAIVLLWEMLNTPTVDGFWFGSAKVATAR